MGLEEAVVNGLGGGCCKWTWRRLLGKERGIGRRKSS